MRRRRLHARVAQSLTGDDGDRISRRAQHLVAALGVVEPAEVVEACRAAARVAEARWSSEVAAEWWAEALRAYDLQPTEHDRDELLVAQVAALARAGRGQTVLDVLEAALLDAARAGRTGTVGRLASSLLRSAGAWPWPTYGDDPGPLLDRLQSLEPLVHGDPAAHVSVLAALAVGRCYDDDATVPAHLSSEALRIAEHLDENAQADALLGRLLTYSGVASHAHELVAHAERLVAMTHGEARVDAAIARAVASMAHLSLGDLDAATEDVRLAVAEADLLQLPVIRVQLRWMEGTLALWRGDFQAAHRHQAIGTRVHLQTELYYAGSWVVARLSLQREDGMLAQADSDGAFEPEPWDAAIAAARGDSATAADRLTAWLDSVGPWVWVTLGHVTLLAEAAADAGLAEHAPRLLALLEPYAGRVAVIGHIGVIGNVDLARGRLHALLGEHERAREVLESALEQARRSGGEPTAQRCLKALGG